MQWSAKSVIAFIVLSCAGCDISEVPECFIQLSTSLQDVRVGQSIAAVGRGNRRSCGPPYDFISIDPTIAAVMTTSDSSIVVTGVAAGRTAIRINTRRPEMAGYVPIMGLFTVDVRQ